MRTLILSILLVGLCRGDDLAKAIEAVTDAPQYAGARWGILVVDDAGKTVYARNVETLFAPASVTKLYSCAAALVTLGPDHRFETPVYAVGNDLVLVASGDLTFGGRTGKDGKTLWRNDDHIYISGWTRSPELTDSNPVAALDELAKKVKAAGMSRVNDVLIDDRLFAASEGTGSGPRVVSPMIVNDNLIDVTVVPGSKPGEPATIVTRPETKYFLADADITTVGEKSPSLLNVSSSDPRDYNIRGRVAVGKPWTSIVPVRKPAEFARTLFIEALRREGVSVSAPLVRSMTASELPRNYDGLKPVATYTSLPFAEMIEVTLKVSHNLYASTLPHLVAVKRGNGKTLADGMRAQGSVLKSLGVDVENISFGGGAGGDRADHVTPKITVQLLQAMQKRPEWATYKQGLPILGVDGTLASSVGPESPAKGKVFAKTGTLWYDDLMNTRGYMTSKALAGVMTTKSGKTLTLAMFENDLPLPAGVKASREGKTLGKLCEIIYEHVP